MAYLSGIVWGIFNILVVLLTIKFYLPKLKIENKNDEVLCDKTEKNHLLYKISLFVISGCGAYICGYISYNRDDYWISVIKIIISLCVICIIAITDYELYIIPNKCVLALIISRVILIIPEVIFCKDIWRASIVNSIISAIFILLFLIAVNKISKGGMGYGDIKLFAALGFMCGIKAIVFTLLLSLFVCAIGSIILLISKTKGLKERVPMGPYIWIGFVLTIALSLC